MLLAHADLVDAIFDELVERLRTELPGFGRLLAIDGKALWTHARPRKKDAPLPAADGRRDIDADFGRKTKHGQHDDGTAWEKVTKWFGYKLHLVVDAEYELPVAYEVTKASAGEAPQAHRLLEQLEERHPAILEACEAWTGDKGHDDGKMIRRLWDGHEILPVIDLKEMWKEPDPTRVLPGHRRIVYDPHGAVYCHCPKTGQCRRMAYGGFEADRLAQKFRCPAVHYGVECLGRAACEVKGAVRVPLEADRRLFTPLARASYAWKRAYKHRTAVENKSRLRFWLNGRPTVDVIVDPAADSRWSKLLADAQSKDHFAPDFFKAKTGHILLQDHGARVAFRNLRIRKLEDSAGEKHGRPEEPPSP